MDGGTTRQGFVNRSGQHSCNIILGLFKENRTHSKAKILGEVPDPRTDNKNSHPATQTVHMNARYQYS